MSDWDPFDDELASALRRRAGSASHDPLATESAHRAVLDRASGIRRRRAAIAGSGTLTVLLVAGLLALNTGGEGDDAVGSATDPTIGDSVAATPSTTEQTDPGGWSDSISSTEPTVVVISVPPPTNTPPVTPPVTSPSTDPSSSVSSSSSSSSSTTTPGLPAGQYPYESAGGRIVVGWDGSALTLIDYEAYAGYTAQIEDEQYDRIRVRFESDSGDVRIECRIVNGQPQRTE